MAALFASVCLLIDRSKVKIGIDRQTVSGSYTKLKKFLLKFHVIRFGVNMLNMMFRVSILPLVISMWF